MLVSLPLAAYLLLFLSFHTADTGWRAAAIHAATVWGVMVVCITELLSLAHWLTRAGLSVTWLIIDIAALAYLWYEIRHRIRRNNVPEFWTARCQPALRLGKAHIGLLTGTGIVIALVGVVALLSPPNTWDAMEYHMPRVVYWLQNRSVAFYPTHELKQLHMPPWAEFTRVHVHGLLGNDGFDNLVQWVSLLGSVIGVMLVARSLGASYRGQVLAAVICATIPQGILQASGSKNDYAAAFWLVALSFYLLAFKRAPTLANAYGTGGALGLAWLTKGTAYVVSLPLLVTWLLIWPRKGQLTFLTHLPLALLLAAGLNAGHFMRNYRLYSSPLGPGAEGPPTGFKYTNDALTLSLLISNVIKNMALHLGTRSRAINTAQERWVEAVVRAFGEDVNNPRTTCVFVNRKGDHLITEKGASFPLSPDL